MKADCYNTSTNGRFDFDNALCIRVCIEQPLISAAWTSYMYFFLHDSTLQSHTVIIWRAKSTIHFCSDWDFYFCLFPSRKDSASPKLNSTAIQKSNRIKSPLLAATTTSVIVRLLSIIKTCEPTSNLSCIFTPPIFKRPDKGKVKLTKH